MHLPKKVVFSVVLCIALRGCPCVTVLCSPKHTHGRLGMPRNVCTQRTVAATAKLRSGTLNGHTMT